MTFNPPSSVITKTKAMWYSNQRNGNLNFSITRKPSKAYYGGLYQWTVIKSIWHFQAISDITSKWLDETSGQNQCSDSEIKLFLERMVDQLRKLRLQRWIILPLNYARIDRTISFGRFTILEGNEDEKIDRISRISHVAKSTVREAMVHIKKTRSKSFLNHPLLIIRTKDYIDTDVAVEGFRAQMIEFILHALFWAYHPANNRFRFRTGYDENQHGVTFCQKGNQKWHSFPLPTSFAVPLDLHFLGLRKHQIALEALWSKLINLDYSDEEIRFRFIRSLRFFAKALQEEESKDRIEGVGIVFTFLMIAAETMFFGNIKGIQRHLKACLPRISNLRNIKRTQAKDAIDFAYLRRCDFVHDGIDTYYDWDETFSEPRVAREIAIIKSMIAKVIIDAPKHIEKMEREAKEIPLFQHWMISNLKIK